MYYDPSVRMEIVRARQSDLLREAEQRGLVALCIGDRPGLLTRLRERLARSSPEQRASVVGA